jgi:putative SOS response-associated peptidase YedK
MCNLYSMTKPQQAVRDLARVAKDITGNLPPLPGIFPDMTAPIIINAPPNSTREMLMMRWGFPQASPKPGERTKHAYVTNVWNTNSPYWRPQLLRPEFRCLVPVTSFCEPDMRSGKCVWTWYALDDSRPVFFFAGIWTSWRGVRGTKAKPEEGNHLVFAFLTTAANAEVAPVHPKAMPVCLVSEEQRETWLNGSAEEALKLQRPAPDGTLRIVRTGEKEDPATA